MYEMTNNIQWDAPFKINTVTTIEGVSKFLIKGILVDTTLNLNQWAVEATDFETLAQAFVGVQIRSDHSEKIENILGKITGTEIDEPHNEAKESWDPPTPYKHLHFIGEISSKNSEVIIPIQQQYITHISPAIDAKMILCGNCRTPMIDKNIRACSCTEGGILLKDLSAREVSLVCSPAYAGTVFKPYAFAASVDRIINSNSFVGNNNNDIEIKDNILKGEEMVNEDRITRLEASVSALIGAFKAAQAEEEEEKVQMKAEEEEKLRAEEEEEAKKMVPVSKVAGEEEEKEEKEDKEDKDEKKIEKLEAAIAQLASLMKASKVTPETPEDEPADSTHSIPKITNEPVKSEKLKDGFKFPLTTGGMVPGKIKAKGGKAQGQSMSFTGATPANKQDSEQAAVDEIFGFAAARGTTPMIPDSRIRTIRY